MADIILTVFNNQADTKRCIESIHKNTGHPHRLIIVDNGSDSPTKDFVAASPQLYPGIPISILRIDQNQGFVKAVNAGMRSSKTDVCLLSNDTIVTPGWLNQMTQLFESDPHIGIVGPQSNNYGLSPAAGESIDDLARSLLPQSGQCTETHYCVGFCMLIRRAVIDAIGCMDEVFSPGYFEDNDFCRRAQKSGFLSVLACSSYVWHREHGTFSSAEREMQFTKNKTLFHARWGVPKRILFPVLASVEKEEQVYAHVKSALIHARIGDWVTIIAPAHAHAWFLNASGSHAAIRCLRCPFRSVFLFLLWRYWTKTKKRFTHVLLTREVTSAYRFMVPFLLALKKGRILYG